MKRFLVITLALSLVLSLGALAQTDTGKSGQKTAAGDSGAKPLKKIAGTIGSDGTSFTADKDKSSWTISNPDAVKGHEGHHVTVSAHVDKDAKSIHVMKVTMAAAKKGAAKETMK